MLRFHDDDHPEEEARPCLACGKPHTNPWTAFCDSECYLAHESNKKQAVKALASLARDNVRYRRKASASWKRFYEGKAEAYMTAARMLQGTASAKTRNQARRAA